MSTFGNYLNKLTDMSKLLYSFLTVLFLVSCSTSSKLKDNRTLLKEYAFCKCFEYASHDTAFFNHDISTGVYAELIGYQREIFLPIDTLAKQAAS